MAVIISSIGTICPIVQASRAILDILYSPFAECFRSLGGLGFVACQTFWTAFFLILDTVQAHFGHCAYIVFK